MTTTRGAVEATHPPFCEGGIACERTQALPADWTHEGRLTQFYVDSERVGIELVRYDGQSGGAGYRRGPVLVRLTLANTTAEEEDSVSVELNRGQLDMLLSFLGDYGAQLDAYIAGRGVCAYEVPNEELPKRNGMTKAQEVWNALDLGRDVERTEGEGGDGPPV